MKYERNLEASGEKGRYLTKKDIWVLFQFHKDKLTEKQQEHIERHLDSTSPNMVSRQTIGQAVKRLKIIERGEAVRRTV